MSEYAERDVMDLSPYYERHVSAMTGEKLHSKSDIAAELAYRDKQIATLEKRLVEAGWQPIETAPVGQRLLFWWSPIGDDKCAQDCVTGSLVYDLDSGERTGEWWNDQTGKYQDIIYLTHWMPLPPPPQENTHD